MARKPSDLVHGGPIPGGPISFLPSLLSLELYLSLQEWVHIGACAAHFGPTSNWGLASSACVGSLQDRVHQS